MLRSFEASPAQIPSGTIALFSLVCSSGLHLLKTSNERLNECLIYNSWHADTQDSSTLYTFSVSIKNISQKCFYKVNSWGRLPHTVCGWTAATKLRGTQSWGLLPLFFSDVLSHLTQPHRMSVTSLVGGLDKTVSPKMAAATHSRPTLPGHRHCLWATTAATWWRPRHRATGQGHPRSPQRWLWPSRDCRRVGWEDLESYSPALSLKTRITKWHMLCLVTKSAVDILALLPSSPTKAHGLSSPFALSRGETTTVWPETQLSQLPLVPQGLCPAPVEQTPQMESCLAACDHKTKSTSNT